MSLEKYMGYVAFQTAWAIFSPQLVGIAHVAGFMLGLTFILGVAGKMLGQFGINMSLTGHVDKKPLSRR